MAERPTALLTGGARGIGRAIAERLATRGYRLVLVDVDDDALAEAAASIAQPDRDAIVVCVTADVSREDAWLALAETLWRDGNDLALCVHSAGVLAAGPLAEASPETIRRVIDTNLTGVLLGCHAMTPLLIDSARRADRANGQTPLPRGVLCVASIFAIVTPPRFAAYSASKAGLVAATQAIRGELAPHGLTATAVLPGVTATGLFARGSYTSDAVRGVVGTESASAGLTPDAVAESALAAYARGRATAVIGNRARRHAWLHRLLGDRLIDAVARRVNATFDRTGR